MRLPVRGPAGAGLFARREAAPLRRTGRFVAPTMDYMQLLEAPTGRAGSCALTGYRPDAKPAGEAE